MAIKTILTCIFFFILHCSTAQAVRNGSSEVVVYPIPSRMPTIDSYTIQVKPGGALRGQYQTVNSYRTMFAEVNTTTGAQILHNTSVAYFDFSGSVDLSIKYNTAHIQAVAMRPYSYGIVASVSGGNVLEFSLTSPLAIIIEINGNIWDTLQLLTHPIETDVPDPQDPDVLYFGPGINNGTAYSNVAGGALSVPSGKTLYIAGGGILEAMVLFNYTTGASLKDRGIIQSSSGEAVEIANSTNTIIQDIITLNSNIYAWTSSGITISGVRSFSWRGNGDGIDLFCSQNASIDNVFMRNSDDNIALYQHRNTYYGNSSNLTIQNSALWADYAHPINIGTHGNTANPETMDGVTIRNIDIMDHHELQMWYQGCIAINPGDGNLIKNVYIKDIRFENFRLGQLVNLRVDYNAKYNTSPGRGIENVVIKDLVYNGTNAWPSLVLGYDEERTISNVTFVGLVVNGKAINDNMSKPPWYYTSDFVPMFINEHVLNLTFVAS